MRNSDAVLVLGEDVTNVAPVLALALRQSVRQQPMKMADKMRIPRWQDSSVRQAMQDAKGPLFIATATKTKLDDVATQTYRAAPVDIAGLGFAVARALGAPLPELQGLSQEVESMAGSIAEALKGAENPLIVTGTSYESEAIIQAAADVAWALRQAGLPARLSFTVPECNSLGAGLMGGLPLGKAFEAVREGRANTVVILENDLYRRATSEEVDAFLSTASRVVVLDHLTNQTNEKADVVLPAATFAESDGTLVNNEGRAQRFFQVFTTRTDMVQESWRWIRDGMRAAGRVEVADWKGLDEVIASMIEAMPFLAPVAEVAPGASFRVAGQKIARQHARYSGRTAMYANVDVSEPKPPADPDSPLAFSMEGFHGQPPSALIPRFWAPGWNSIQALNKFQSEVGGELEGGDPGRRLIEPEETQTPPYFRHVPASFQARREEWLAVPMYHIFGSDELSIQSPGVAELSPLPQLALHPDDARTLALSEGDAVELPLGGVVRRLTVSLAPELPEGVAGLSAGLPGMYGIELPTWSRLRA